MPSPGFQGGFPGSPGVLWGHTAAQALHRSGSTQEQAPSLVMQGRSSVHPHTRQVRSSVS